MVVSLRVLGKLQAEFHLGITAISGRKWCSGEAGRKRRVCPFFLSSLPPASFIDRT